MPEIVVIDVEAGEDLGEFSRYLWSQRVSHRVVEHNGRKLLLVGDARVAEQVADIWQQQLIGDNKDWQQATIDGPQPVSASTGFVRILYNVPATVSLIILSIIGFFIVENDPQYNLVRHLTFFDFELSRSSITFSVAEGEFWRLITPIFLHFGTLHLVFNSTMLWFVGHRIELLQSRIRMLAICLLIALGSNIAQAIYAELGIFGGMSGVVYGLLGYSWAWSRLRPEEDLQVPNAIFYFSLVMMVLGFMGITAMGPGKVANLAHLGGLVIGAILGAGMAANENSKQHK